jgi:hypothetical protein
MRIFLYLELTVVLLIAVIVVTQIIIPKIRGTKCWPTFGREGKLERELIDANQQIAEQRLEEELQARKDQIKPADKKETV